MRQRPLCRWLCARLCLNVPSCLAQTQQQKKRQDRQQAAAADDYRECIAQLSKRTWSELHNFFLRFFRKCSVKSEAGTPSHPCCPWCRCSVEVCAREWGEGVQGVASLA